MTIEERIQDLRKRKGISQEQLAEILGVSRQAVSKWEGGQSLPEVEKLIAMSTLFEVSTDYILKGETPPSQPAKEIWRRNSLLVAQTLMAMATMVLLVGIITSLVPPDGEAAADNVYGGLIVESSGIMLLLMSCFIAGNRIANKPLFAVNILLAGVLPSMMVPVSWLALKGEEASLSVAWFWKTPGVLPLFTVTYITVCGIVLYFTVIRKRKNNAGAAGL